MPFLKNSILFLSILYSACNNKATVQATNAGEIPSVSPFRLTSPAFANGDTIPMIYTCDSSNISPPLHWNNPFTNAASFALIMDDPDAPMQTWVHWVVFNIPSSDTTLPIHLPTDSILANGTKQGVTSFLTNGYGGSCPPEGVHRYYFKLYALDTKLNIPSRISKSQLNYDMKGHILAEADLMGRYSRKKKAQ